MASRLLRSQAGNVGVIFALAAIPVLGLAGGAVDLSVANNARSALQNVCDSAALAATKSPFQTISGFEDVASKYIQANAPEPYKSVAPNVTVDSGAGGA
ncbi:MAG TPA: pilus assembly protein, partial [Rhizobiales bacterium]|nr:pilus assembly protein [Hyphomicrobiales bacterium]